MHPERAHHFRLDEAASALNRLSLHILAIGTLSLLALPTISGFLWLRRIIPFESCLLVFLFGFLIQPNFTQTTAFLTHSLVNVLGLPNEPCQKLVC